MKRLKVTDKTESYELFSIIVCFLLNIVNLGFRRFSAGGAGSAQQFATARVDSGSDKICDADFLINSCQIFS